MNAWGVTAETEYEIVPKTSLQQIMDEALALKLQSDQEANEYVVLSPTRMEPRIDANTDEDFAMALQLQQEEQLDYQQRQALLNQNKPGTSSHINLQYREDPYVKQLQTLQYSVPEEEREDYPLQSIPKGSWYKDGAGNYKSKHDLEVCGRKNAKDLEAHHDIALDDDCIVPNRAYNALKETLRSREKIKGVATKGRVEAATRATSDAVLDERTRLILLKLMNREDLEEIHGVIRSGKEANVYGGMRLNMEEKMSECAVKIFKTTLTAFRNRYEYVLGDFRFDQGYQQKDLIRQTNVWTKKEFSNLCRAEQAGIRVPHPYCFKEHVLIMSFIGKNDWPAPQLRELGIGSLSTSQFQKCYIEIVQSMRQLYQVARLVHADLSPYNILFYEKTCYFIDFGQAVDTTHPNQKDYLNRDIATINTYFEQLKNPDIVLFSVDDCLQYITEPDLFNVALLKTDTKAKKLLTKYNIDFKVTGKAKERLKNIEE